MVEQTKLVNSVWDQVVKSRFYWILCSAILLLLFILTSCTAGNGKLYEWCKKRDFPAICQKFL